MTGLKNHADPYCNLSRIQTYEILNGCKHHPKDAVLLIENKELRVHKCMLVILSPIFQVIISKIDEKRLPALIGVDSTYNAVKDVIDYCLGHDLGEKQSSEIVAMLNFAATYNIQIGIEKLEQVLKNVVTPTNLPKVAEYAWTHHRDELKYECGRIFFNHRNEISADPEFASLDPIIAVGIIKMAQIHGRTRARWAEEAAKEADIYIRVFKVIVLLFMGAFVAFAYEFYADHFGG